MNGAADANVERTGAVSDLVLVALITAIPGTIAAIVSWDGRRTAKVAVSKVDDLHVIVNDRLTQLLASTATSAKLEGVSEERARGQEMAASVSRDTAEITAAHAAGEQAAAESRTPREGG